MTELHNNRREYSTSGLTVREIPVEITDEFANDRFDEINAEVERLGALSTAYYAGEGLDTDRKRLSSIDMINNPGTRELTEMLPSVSAWLNTIPTAAALHPLYEPDSPTLPNGTVLDQDIPDWFKNIADARGIRSRAVIMKDVLRDEVSRRDGPQAWLSLASGAAQPVFSVLDELGQEGYPIPTVTLADKDKTALRLARGYAEGRGLGSSITTKNANVLAKEGLAYERQDGVTGLAKGALLRARGRFEAESFDAVDAVGIFEYLKRPDWKYTYNKVISTSKELAGAENFMKHAFELVKPGGVLIVGNMLDTHPQLEFTLNVIQWPHIQPRSVEEMIDIMSTVGVEGEVDVYRPSDGVYAVYAIRKPLAE